MTVRSTLLALVVLAISSSVRAATPPSAVEFEGLWQAVPNRPRPPRGSEARTPGPRRRGAQADEKGLTAGDYRVRGMMTDAGQAAFDAFDPYELPANNCESPGLPHIAVVPNLQEWRFEGNTLRITHEYYSTKRAIHLDGDLPDDLPKTPAGYATARFEGDTLVIRTMALAATLGGLSRNAPSSDARVVTERYRILPDGSGIGGQITIEDEKFLTRPIRLPLRLTRPEPDAELILFPCDPEAARRHLPPRNQ
ncbi:MAG: hypothetical protein OXN89_13160 [Bryobacterales bacterium]|nr:hypothetical protein [Bryobacterales bacterium]